MKTDEVIAPLSTLGRLMDTVDNERVNVFDFGNRVGPHADGVERKADTLERARAAVKATPAPGFEIDLSKARRLGRGHFVKELTQ